LLNIDNRSSATICFAYQYFDSDIEIEKPWLVFYVACAGIVVNICGMFLFHGHSHAHGHNPTHIEEDEVENIESIAYNYDVVRIADRIHDQELQLDNPIEYEPVHSRTQSVTESTPLVRPTPIRAQSHPEIHSANHEDSHGHSDHHNDHHHHSSHADLNMHGLFIHILGDLMASLGVITSTAIIIYVDQPWTIYLDPVMSLIITFIVIYSTIPLVKSASYILLQGMPSTISMERIRKGILKIPHIIDVHELHVWQLSEGQTIGSVHVELPRTIGNVPFSAEQYMAVAVAVKKELHV
jgi:solute carrier family 30 (zinc transporter), member 1